MENTEIIQELIESISYLTNRFTIWAVIFGLFSIAISVLLWVQFKTGKHLESLIGHLDHYYEDDSLPDELTFKNAEQLWLRNELASLKDICNEELTLRPNNISAVWYLALIDFHQENYLGASKRFTQIMNQSPSYRHDCQLYIEQIEILKSSNSDVKN